MLSQKEKSANYKQFYEKITTLHNQKRVKLRIREDEVVEDYIQYEILNKKTKNRTHFLNDDNTVILCEYKEIEVIINEREKISS